MTGSTTAASLDLTESLRGCSSETSPPVPIRVETELQRLVSQRLDRATDGDSLSGSRKGSRSPRARIQRKEPIAGAFDSPQGFVYVSDAVSHKST